MATQKTVQIAQELLPHLVYLAQQGEVASYGEVADRIGRHPFNLRYPLAYIRDEITEPRELPMLTSLVVLKSSGIPGDALLAEGREGMSDAEYAARCKQLQAEVFDYRRWEKLLVDLDLEPIARSVDELDTMGDRFRDNFDGRDEWTDDKQEAHEALQQFILDNPTAIYHWQGDAVQRDVMFPTGDRCDLLYDRGSLGYTLVAVRQGKRGELAAAIQKLDRLRDKFREVEKLEQETPIQARVVAYRIPQDLREYADAHDVKYTTIRQQRVEEAVER